MPLRFYLAMTEAEIRNAPILPKHLAYMACHFSPYGTGLVNIPEKLPPGSILIVNDRVPVTHHNPGIIANQLSAAVRKLKAYGVLMDLQVSGNQQTAKIVEKVIHTLPCPVAVSEPYANDLSCPIFGAPAIYQPIADYIRGKKGRPLWLETFEEAAILTVTPSDCKSEQCTVHTNGNFYDETLQCRYTFNVEKGCVRFTLSRRVEESKAYLQTAQSLGIEVAIGLYQEFYNISL